MQRIVGVICLLVVVLASGLAGADSSATDTAMQKARSLKGNLSSSSGINSWLFGPATSDDTKFKTFDLGKEFEAKVMCQGEAPVVTVTAFPNGNITSVGELNFRVDYDLNLDGEVEGTTYINQVAGACANGAVFGCDPGTWKNCSYAQLQIKDGQIVPVSEFTGSEAGTSIPRGPHGLKGCFCFNAACGSPVLSMLEQILSNIGMGFVDLIRQRNQGVAITKTDYNMGEMKLSFIGAKATNCAGLGTEAEVQGLTALQDQVDFPVQNALDNQPEGSAYKALEASFENDARQFYSCTINSTVSSEIKESVRKVLTKFGIGWDADGSSKQCYYFSEGGCGSYFGEPGSWQGCLDQVVPTGLHKICSDLHVSGGYFTEITNVSHYKETSGLFATESIGFGCYGGGESCCDNSDQWWEMLCWGKRLDDSFVCHSPSMGAAGEVIHNDPYFENKYQGCETIYYYENKCAALEKREDCHLVQEKTDGVFTIKDGQLTGVSTPTSCRTFKGAYRSISVCEPWWTRERLYECSPLDVNFNKERQRVQHITQSVDYDKTTGTWGTQGDMLFNGDTSITKIFDANIQFDTNFENCMPGCVVAAETVNTGIYLPGQGKLAADGHYHVPEKVEQTYVAGGGPKTVLKTVNCVKNETTGAYSCPVDTAAGEEARTDCLCVDNDQFAQVVAQLMSVDQAGKDVICSTGENIGMCSAEDAGAVKRVICGDFKMGEDGQVIIDETTIWDCLPKLWKGPAIRQQYHEVWANDEYKCMAKIPAYPEDDHFDNYIGSLSPQSEWFDPVVDWAKAFIVQALNSDPAFIPAPGPDCLCPGDGSSNSTSSSDGQGGSLDCSWTTDAAVDHINRKDILELRPDNQDPFGDVILSITSTGFWTGKQFGGCIQQNGSCTPNKMCPITNGIYDSSSTCEENCVLSGACESAASGQFKCKDGTTYTSLNACLANCTVSTVYDTLQQCTSNCSSPSNCHESLSTHTERIVTTCTYSTTYQKGDRWCNRVNCDSISCPAGSTQVGSGVTGVCTMGVCCDMAPLPINRSLGLPCTYEDPCPKGYPYVDCNITEKKYVCIEQDQGFNTLQDCSLNCQDGKQCKQITTGYDYNDTVTVTDVLVGMERDLSTGCYSPNIQPASCPAGYVETNSIPICKNYFPCKFHTYGNPVSAATYCLNQYTCVKANQRYVCSSQNLCTEIPKTMCKLNGQYFTDAAQCDKVCKEDISCVDSAKCEGLPGLPSINFSSTEECNQSCQTQSCRTTGKTYLTYEECYESCFNSFTCASQSKDYKFKSTIRNDGNNNYTQELDQIEPLDEKKHIASTTYTRKDLILRQCLDRYVQPYLKFDDPNELHFEVSKIDQLAYQFAAERKELPRDDTSGTPWSLPLYPPAYLPGKDNTNSTLSYAVPNSPMFFDRDPVASFVDDNSYRLGRYGVNLSPKSPYVYYYECPEGDKTKSTTNNCGAVDPFGGVDSTVDGTWCFQRRCDAQAVMEPEGVLSGCGMANDGEWN